MPVNDCFGDRYWVGIASMLVGPGIRRFRSVTPSPSGVIRMAFLHRLEPVDGFQLG